MTGCRTADGSSAFDEVIAFWFDTLRPADWWRGSPALDREIDARFGALHRQLAADPPAPASLDASGRVAAVIVLDQFPRHLYRGTARSFATDDAALAITTDAIARRLDASLPTSHRHFLYMPLMHSEDPAIQRASLERFGALGDPRALRSACDHHDTIVRFGRFPGRNAALGRPSTDAELAWLAERAEAATRRRS